VPPKHKVSIIACARWETQYIAEWLLYHRSIGFDHVYLYCNDDDPAALYSAVLPFCEGGEPFVTFRHYPFQAQKFYMYLHAMEQYKDESEWIACLDIDEFLALREFDDIKAYLATRPADWDCIHFNRSVFGPGNYVDRPLGSVLSNYVRREAILHPGSKTLTRSAKIELSRIPTKLPFWHGWRDALGPDFHGYNILGDRIEAVLGDDDGRAYLKTAQMQARIRAAAIVHRYVFKSQKDLRMRAAGSALGDDEALLQQANAVEDTYLADYWRRYLRASRDAMVIPPSGMPNVSVGKRADQSSTSQWSNGTTTTDDAAGAVSGRITGQYQFHTEHEAQPWWSVDLGESHIICEVRVFNRVDQPELRRRLGRFNIEVSPDGATWDAIHQNDGAMPVGGVDGHPLIVKLPAPAVAQQVRIRCLDPTFLHLDQAEVYGVSLR
jgi:hypothetical protein